jgi:predicted TIM-barrel fold metal-dependent hydrolase
MHADSAGVRRFDLLEKAVQRASAEKLLFGSDGPWLHPAAELAKVRLLGLTPADEALVLGGNLLRLISRVRRAGWRAESAAPGR